MDNRIYIIINDIISKLDINIKEEDIYFFTDRKTNSLVFSIDNKYLIKTIDTKTLKNQKEFLEFYKDISNLQKIIYYNEKLEYICFKYIDGVKYNNSVKIDAKDMVKKIFDFVKQYKEYNYQGYGYLGEDNKEWSQFLEDEVKYSSQSIKEVDISLVKVYKALDNIKKIQVPQYLIHGDFGTHNFLISNQKLIVIDPMPIIGDYLYDFYFAILSNVKIFNKLNINDILNLFDRNIDYKKNLFIIILYIRMCRCYVYNRTNFDIYHKLYNNL